MITGLLGYVGWQYLRPASPQPLAATAPVPALAAATPAAPARMASVITTSAQPRADSLVHFAMQQLGSPYTYAGTTPTGGFDCSGFLMFVYGHFGVPVPHSTALLINTGRPVERSQARRGDMVIFTGTATTSTTPGHAGIVISEGGEPLRFIHSSSARRESGVKISQVEGTDYERRFMGIRRVLGVVPGGPAAKAKAPTPPAAAPAAAVVAALPARKPRLATTLVVPPPRVRGLSKAKRSATAVRLRPKPRSTARAASPARYVKKKAVAPKRVARKTTASKSAVRKPATSRKTAPR
ncbi:C40 family peptidase [Hymenobacter daecheongensis]|uniref:C40 family peptidase n=1 Tax=Hymenobacter daecheongensis TaxID=496053 RepID=UPI001F30C220|nr:C40 family peptidase [Hymenobacter daecheongensis]